MTQHEELIERVMSKADVFAFHMPGGQLQADAREALQQEIADALESQTREIAALKAQEAELCTLYGIAEAECKRLRKDAERLDWLESSEVMHGFCHMGNGDFRHYAHQQKGYPSVRAVLDAAIAAKGGSDG